MRSLVEFKVIMSPWLAKPRFTSSSTKFNSKLTHSSFVLNQNETQTHSNVTRYHQIPTVEIEVTGGGLSCTWRNFFIHLYSNAEICSV